MYREFTPRGLNSRLQHILELKDAVYAKDIRDLHVFISPGNSKTGEILSVSLLPVFDCGNCQDCMHSCYDLAHDMIYSNTIMSRWINHRLSIEEPTRFFREIKTLSSLHRAFRWHVGGDIRNLQYLLNIIDIARGNPNTEYLIYTKMFDAVNRALELIPKPDNLHIMMSAWKHKIGSLRNPHHLPIFVPEFTIEGKKYCAYETDKVCGGSCTECLLKKEGCFGAEKGDVIKVQAH